MCVCIYNRTKRTYFFLFKIFNEHLHNILVIFLCGTCDRLMQRENISHKKKDVRA